ncbi:MAG: PRC-barrel domain-containing protein, partial [Myxococcota bacterium]
LQDLVVDLHTGSIAYAVVGFGGRFGFGHRRIAVPWTRLTVEAARLVLDATPDQLRAARPLDGREWPRWPDPVFQPRKWTV